MTHMRLYHIGKRSLLEIKQKMDKQEGLVGLKQSLQTWTAYLTPIIQSLSPFPLSLSSLNNWPPVSILKTPTFAFWFLVFVYTAVWVLEIALPKMTVEEIRASLGSENDRFPVGMRVLAVDDDPTCLKLLDTMLQKCQYQGLILLSCVWFKACSTLNLIGFLVENWSKFCWFVALFVYCPVFNSPLDWGIW